MYLFKAGCNSILLYGCEPWIHTEALIYKLDILEYVSQENDTVSY